MNECKRVVALLVVLLVAVAVAGQERVTGETSAYGGELRMIAKAPAQTSGSLGISLMGNGLKGYEGTFGGTLVKDRMWFFASAERNDGTGSRSSVSPMPEFLRSEGLSGKLDAQLGDRQSLGAAFLSRQGSFAGTPSTNAFDLPSSFLSLRYTGIVTGNMFFTATATRSSASPRLDSPIP